MADPFDKAVDAGFTATGFAKTASYSPTAGGGPLSVKMHIRKEPGGESFGGIGVSATVVTAQVRVSEISAAAKGDTFTIGSDTYRVTRVDKINDDLVWLLALERTS